MFTLFGGLLGALVGGSFLLTNERKKRLSESEELDRQTARAAALGLLVAVEANYRGKKLRTATNMSDGAIQVAWAEVQIACKDMIVEYAGSLVRASYAFEPYLKGVNQAEDTEIANKARNMRSWYGAMRGAYIELLSLKFGTQNASKPSRSMMRRTRLIINRP